MRTDARLCHAPAVHSLGRVPLISEISRFHGQLLRLLTFLSIWVHWDACIQYGSCANPRHNRCASPGPPLPVLAESLAPLCLSWLQASLPRHMHCLWSSSTMSGRWGMWGMLCLVDPRFPFS